MPKPMFLVQRAESETRKYAGPLGELLVEAVGKPDVTPHAATYMELVNMYCSGLDPRTCGVIELVRACGAEWVDVIQDGNERVIEFMAKGLVESIEPEVTRWEPTRRPRRIGHYLAELRKTHKRWEKERMRPVTIRQIIDGWRCESSPPPPSEAIIAMVGRILMERYP